MDEPLESLSESVKDTIPSILGNQVSISNQAARAAHGFTIREKRLMMAGVSKLNPKKSVEFYNTIKSRTFRVTAHDYAELSQITDIRSAYKDLMAACDNLFNRYFRYEILTPRGIKERKHRWVEQIEYQHGQGYVEFTFSQTMMPFLANLNKEFTKYRLEQTSALRSIYSWRLLELLLSYSNDEFSPHTQTVSLENFRYQLEIPETYKFANIKQRIIIPAVEELTKKDGWEIEWKAKKNGRAVAGLTFTYSRQKQKDMFRND